MGKFKRDRCETLARAEALNASPRTNDRFGWFLSLT
jgi:hypothetical protein